MSASGLAVRVGLPHSVMSAPRGTYSVSQKVGGVVLLLVIKRKQIMDVLSFVAIGLALMISIVVIMDVKAGRSRSVIEWGLSFSVPNQPPQGTVDAETLRQYNALYSVKTPQKLVCLTFDAGYENGYMPSILDTLKRHKVSAAFFLVGHYLQSQPELVRRMVAEGHVVGNHTMNHPGAAKLNNPAVFTKELQDFEALYQEVVGAPCAKYYRPPGGLYAAPNLETARDLGYTTVFWSLAYADWDVKNQPDPTAAMEKLTGRIHPGAVVLLHSTSRTNAQILDQLITTYQEMGYTFVPLYTLTA